MESSLVQELASITAQDGYLGISLADILMSNALGRNQATLVASKLEALAQDFDVTEDFLASRDYYKSSARWCTYSNDELRAADMTFEEAEALVKEATSRVSSEGPSYAVAAGFLENAIQVYRSIPRVHRDRNQVELRIQEIGLRHSEYGERALEEMTTVSTTEIYVGEEIERARQSVTDNPLPDALLAFTKLHSISVSQLRQFAIDSLTRSAFRASIPVIHSSDDGRIVARTAGISGSSPSEDDEVAIHSEMTSFHYLPVVSVAVQARILPALDVLNLEHRLPEPYLIELARRSPIVPIGREVLFGKALAAGFNRDFAAAIHLLTPQIENMVRFHLKSAGVRTTHLDQNGIETENGLSALIDIPESESIFGADITYEIRSMFCDQFGANLRNNVAHGLLDDRQSYSIESIYGWWLGLKLVCNAFWNSLRAVGETEVEEDGIDGPAQC